jgi:hypothetical protein
MRLPEKTKGMLFCEKCKIIEKDTHERELFEKFYKVKIEELREWEKRKEFLRELDALDLKNWAGEEKTRELGGEK